MMFQTLSSVIYKCSLLYSAPILAINRPGLAVSGVIITPVWNKETQLNKVFNGSLFKWVV